MLIEEILRVVYNKQLYFFSGQFQVVGSQQTTLCRLKLGSPVTKPTLGEKIKNFWSFLLRGRVPLSSQAHYFNTV